MSNRTLTRDDWAHIHAKLVACVRVQTGKLRNARKKGLDTPQTRLLAQDTERTRELADRVKP